MDEISSQSATRITALIRTRSVSPVEVVKSFLERIEQLNPSLNAIVTVSSDLEENARAAERAVMTGKSLGPLHGLPVTIKDTIETGGLLTTSGSLVRAGFVPDEDAPAVARLKAAGAIILGKTNAAEMAMDYTADNPVFGRTNNPYNPSRTPGGSSGGEAAAISACLSPAGLGSDLAGSIRIPAHFCGICGLKPTTGQVPGDGQFPPSVGPYSLGAVIGPLARRVEDLDLLFGILSQQGPSADVSRQVIDGRRVAWYTDDTIAPVTDETRAAVKTAASALASAGAITEEMRPPGVERGHELWLKLFSRASVVQLRNVYGGFEQDAGPFVRWRLATADDKPPPTLDDYIKAWMERDMVRAGLLQWMEDVPILVTPVGGTNAVEHDTLKVTVGEIRMSMFRAFSYSQTANVFDLPAVVVPVSMSRDGLPIGVQILGRPFAEKEVLRIAEIVETSLGGWRAPSI